MEALADTLAATLLGANPASITGVVGTTFIITFYLIFDSWTLLWIAIACRVCNSILIYLVRSSIRNQAVPRKQALLAQFRRDREEQEKEKRDSSKADDEEWEQVEGRATGSAENGQGGGPDTSWEGVIGFLHPFCNAGGGGERVLWAAIKATQEKYPKAICIVYTGDHDSNKSTILQRVSRRFDIHLHSPSINFLYLNTRDYVVASYWPQFTLLGQALGSILMAWDALSLTTPDVLVDTMGYTFSTAFCRYFYPEIPTGAYVHYPFIGTHMVDSLTSGAGQGINAGAGKGARGLGKRLYWRLLVGLYIMAGRSLDVVMTNSSWTRAHMIHLWGRYRRREQKPSIEVVFPPVAVEEIINAIPLDGPRATAREKNLVYIAQFRPEKNHELILQSFSKMVHSDSEHKDARLVLIGSVRDSEDETLVYKLRLLAHELMIEEAVDFRTKDVSWPEILVCLQKSSLGVNGMWCEHFGIGVVEYQAAGLISVVNDSGGPKQDIVTEFDGGATGFRATTTEEYAARFAEALSMPAQSSDAMRHRARASSKRFTTAVFAVGWIHSLQQLIDIQKSRKR